MKRSISRWLFVVALCGQLLVGGSLARSSTPAGDDEASQEDRKYATHDYLVRIRPSLWLVLVDGAYETDTPSGNDVSIRVDGDLGYDESYPSLAGDVALRWRRHDFWVTGVLFDEDEDRRIQASFEIGGKDFDVGGIVESTAQITDVNFRYGYSFFEFEEDGFRLGPTLAVSYTNLSVKIKEVTIAGVATGTRASYEETLPVPTVGVHGEVPFGDFVVSTQMGGFWASTSDFDASGIRAAAEIVWRPFRYAGLFAGMNVIYADLELSGEKIDDLVIWGPVLGLELRY